MLKSRLITESVELDFQKQLNTALEEIEGNIGIVKEVMFSTTAVSYVPYTGPSESTLQPWYSALIVYVAGDGQE